MLENREDWGSKKADALIVTFYDQLKSQADKVVKEDIPWDGYRGAGLITEDEARAIKKFDKRQGEIRSKLIATEGEKYVDLFLQLLVKVNKDATLQYILTLVDQVITDNKDTIQLFLALSQQDPLLPFEPFLRLLNRTTNDWYTNAKASLILVTLMVKATSVPEDAVKFVSGWLKKQFLKTDDREISVAVTALQTFLLKRNFRPVFASDDGLSMLGTVVRAKQKNPQLVYQALNCIWLLTYCQEVYPYVLPSKIIDAIVSSLRASPKEKIIRMGLASLRNMTKVEGATETMIDAGIVKPLDSFKQRNWGDEDLLDDLEVVYNEVQKGLAHLSSFDMYKREVASGKLDFSSPAHRSEKFWRENIDKFEEDHCRVLLYLKEILLSSTDAAVLSVACFDVGEFARFHPRGRAIISTLGIKEPMMALMASRDPDTKKQALLALQKVMVTNWEYIN